MNTNKNYIKRTLWISSIMLTALVTGCNSSNDSSENSVVKVSGPSVIATSPAESANAAPLNHKVIATFSEAMDATTVDTVSFSVSAEGEQALSGDVSVDAASHSAIFTPSNDFKPSTDYTATLTTAIKSTSGSIALANNYVWQFTSGTTTDSVAPSVDSTTPVDTATDVLLNRAISAQMSELLDPATVNASTFTLSDGGAAVSGVVSNNGTVVTFNPSSNLDAGTSYTATLTTVISDLAGNNLPMAKTWSFTTGSTVAQGPAPVNLGTAGDFAILTKTALTNVPTSIITGNIGASPIAGAAIDPTCDEVSGLIYGSDATYTGNGDVSCYKGVPADNTLVANAVLDMDIAYNDAAGRTTPDYTELYAGDLSGKTLVPGLYKWSSDVLINTDVTLSGGANDVWIFQVAGDVALANAKSVILEGGALAKNIFWQVGGGTSVALGTDAHLEGIVLAAKAITVNTGATVNGRLLSQTSVTLQKNTVKQPAE